MKNKLNLLPKDLIKKETKGLNFQQFKIVGIIILPLLIWKLAVFGIHRGIKSATDRKMKEIVELEQKISTLKISAETELKDKQEKLNLLNEQISLKEKGRDELKPIEELVAQKKDFVYELLKAITEHIPQEVWLEEINLQKEDNACSFKGYGLSYAKISLFISRLNQFSYLKELCLKKSEKIDEGNLIKFEITGKLNL
ncbi:MAG: PilN domain-containing protein [Candidatus Omnitrophota bacterium]